MAEGRPEPDALVAQLKELNERSRTYGRQFWQVPLAYLAAAGVIVVQAADGKHAALTLPLALLVSGGVGVFVVWHLASLWCAARRSFDGIIDLEEALSLPPKATDWRPRHLWWFLLLPGV